MRSILTILLLGIVRPTYADETEKQAREIVEKAIQQIGGQENWKELTAGTWKTNGTANGRPSRAEFHGELPGKFRIDSDRVVDGKTVRFSRIVNGKSGWVVEGEKVRPMTEAEIANVKSSFYHKQLATTLTPLLDKEVKLQFLGSVDLDGKPVSRIRVEQKDHPDLLLDFDAETGLLSRSQMTEKNPVTGKEKKVELRFAEYKEFGKIKMATRTKSYNDGKLFIDTELIEFKGAKSLPKEIFENPKR